MILREEITSSTLEAKLDKIAGELEKLNSNLSAKTIKESNKKTSKKTRLDE